MSAPAEDAGAVWQTKQRDLCFLPLGPRTTSTQSPTPLHGEDQRNVKRRLLVIYIHGFIGSEDSFHSFPSQVHMQLKIQLARTHVVHSKIYPRYKTYKAFHLARDNLSQWLSAHEGPDTDVILVGHSMGGLLASEVVLMRKKMPGYRSTRKHSILGTVHLDAPLLGAQNRVILAGVLSPFRSKTGLFAMQHTSPSNESFNRSCSIRTSPVAPPMPESNPDPHFNQPFANDIRIQNRSSWESVLHFARKHKDEGLALATFRHWKSHFEFGSCLLNSRRLKEQYVNLRKLDSTGPSIDATTHSRSDEQVRFVQFYTASYKGRTGKRFLEKKFSEENDRPETANDRRQRVVFAENKADQKPGKWRVNNGSLEDNDDPEELYFCKLARLKDGVIDPLWRKVMMATNDEINAHTALFLPGPHYQDLIDQVSTEMTSWASGRGSSDASQKYASS
ncbi:hypothetical protein NU219Hw_g4709t1 [Hortaea werneckii]